MTRWRNFILPVMPLLLIGCFLLPNAVSCITDAQRLEKLALIESQSVSFESGENLNIIERLALSANPATESLSLKNGRFLDSDTASVKTLSELIRFFQNSEVDFDFENYTVEECSAIFTIDSDDPSVNIITWSVKLTDSSQRTINVTIDDETGSILSLLYRNDPVSLYSNNAKIVPHRGSSDTGENDSLHDTAVLLARLLSDYYKLPITLEDYMLSGEFAYYRADLAAGGIILPMYGVVRDSGFSINERVSGG